MDRVLKGKVALVTGASSGFGAGIAGQLAKNEATVYIMARIMKKQGFIFLQFVPLKPGQVGAYMERLKLIWNSLPAIYMPNYSLMV